jgi:hypothetical protein
MGRYPVKANTFSVTFSVTFWVVFPVTFSASEHRSGITVCNTIAVLSGQRFKQPGEAADGR